MSYKRIYIFVSYTRRERISDDQFKYYLISLQNADDGYTVSIPFIADQLTFCGKVSKWADWKIISIDSAKDIRLIDRNYTCQQTLLHA